MASGIASLGLGAARFAGSSLNELGKRYRRSENIPEDVSDLKNYISTLNNDIDLCREKINDSNFDQKANDWQIKLLNICHNDIREITQRNAPHRPKNHTRNVLNTHVRRDEERLTRAKEKVKQIRDEFYDTLTLGNHLKDPNCQHQFIEYFAQPAVSKYAVSRINTNDDSVQQIREGKLQQYLINSQQQQTEVQNNLQASIPRFCAHGPGGMGKTVALQLLCFDNDIKKRFPDGIHWFSLGQNSTTENFLDQIRLCAINMGDDPLTEALATETSPNIALRRLAPKFKRKTVLFIIDDFWSEHVRLVKLLEQVLRQGSNCCVVISTRLRPVANTCSEIVSFSLLDPFGQLSRDILLSRLNATNNEKEIPMNEILRWIDRNKSCTQSLNNCLSECGGYVLCLSIASALLKQHIINVDTETLTTALHTWEQKITTRTHILIEKTADEEYEHTLTTVVSRSLDQCKKLLKERTDRTNLSNVVIEKFKSMCVMQKQKVIPKSVLIRLWDVSINDADRIIETLEEMSLVEVVQTGNNRATFDENLQMHDKLIDICCEMSKADMVQNADSEVMNNQEDGLSIQHKQLLGKFLSDSSAIEYQGSAYRPWWDNKVDNMYMIENLGYHLMKANLETELWCLLTDVRWLLRWIDKIGSWPGLSHDFTRIGEEGHNQCIPDREGLNLIRMTLQNMWLVFKTHRHVLGFEMFARLDASEQQQSIIRFLNSIEEFGPKPWLQPCRPYFAEKSKSVTSRVKLSSTGASCSWLSDDKFVSTAIVNTGDGKQLCSFDLMKQEQIQCLDLPATHRYKVLAVSAKANLVVLIIDGKLFMWGLGRTDLMPLSISHDTTTAKIGAISNDGQLLALRFDDDTWSVIRLEDGENETTGTILYQLPIRLQGSCATFSNDTKLLAFGSYCGTLYVWRVCDGSNQFTPLKVLDSSIDCLNFGADGDVIVLGLSDGSVQLRHSADGSLIFDPLQSRHDGVSCVQISKSEEYMVCGHSNGVIQVRSVEDGTKIFEETVGENCWPICVRFGAEDQTVISGSSDGTVIRWTLNRSTGSGVSALDGQAASSAVQLKREDNKRSNRSMEFSNDGQLFANTTYKYIFVGKVGNEDVFSERGTCKAHCRNRVNLITRKSRLEGCFVHKRELRYFYATEEEIAACPVLSDDDPVKWIITGSKVHVITDSGLLLLATFPKVEKSEVYGLNWPTRRVFHILDSGVVVSCKLQEL